MISVKCVNFRTFLQISWGIVWGIVYFKFYPRSFSFSTFGYQYFELFSIFFGKCEHSEHQKCPHNPEVVGSSPASATIIIPDFLKKSGIFLTFVTIFLNLKLCMRRNGARLAAGLWFPVVVSWVFNLGDGGLVFTMLCPSHGS